MAADVGATWNYYSSDQVDRAFKDEWLSLLRSRRKILILRALPGMERSSFWDISGGAAGSALAAESYFRPGGRISVNLVITADPHNVPGKGALMQKATGSDSNPSLTLVNGSTFTKLSMRVP